MQELRLERVGYGHPDAMRLIADVQAEYTVLYGSPDETPLDPAMFELPTGSFFVGYLHGAPVATGAWRARPDVVDLGGVGGARPAEIKRMYVAPGARGHGQGRTILAHLEASAAAQGHGVMVLETGTMQPAAIALYRSVGYEDVPGFGYYKDAPESVYLGRSLHPALRDVDEGG